MILSPKGLLNAMAYTTFLWPALPACVRQCAAQRFQAGDQGELSRVCVAMCMCLLTLESQQLFTRCCVPDFARPVVAPRDESVPALVECTVGEGQNVGTEDLEQVELLVLVCLLLLHQLVQELADMRPLRIGDEGLPGSDLIDHRLHVGTDQGQVRGLIGTGAAVQCADGGNAVGRYLTRC